MADGAFWELPGPATTAVCRAISVPGTVSDARTGNGSGTCRRMRRPHEDAFSHRREAAQREISGCRVCRRRGIRVGLRLHLGNALGDTDLILAGGLPDRDRHGHAYRTATPTDTATPTGTPSTATPSTTPPTAPARQRPPWPARPRPRPPPRHRASRSRLSPPRPRPPAAAAPPGSRTRCSPPSAERRSWPEPGASFTAGESSGTGERGGPPLSDPGTAASRDLGIAASHPGR